MIRYKFRTQEPHYLLPHKIRPVYPSSARKEMGAFSWYFCQISHFVFFIAQFSTMLNWKFYGDSTLEISSYKHRKGTSILRVLIRGLFKVSYHPENFKFFRNFNKALGFSNLVLRIFGKSSGFVFSSFFLPKLGFSKLCIIVQMTSQHQLSPLSNNLVM